ncbi:transient receptor potential cation channel subfamily A member 1-like isoform X2 [Lytechinus variegatus]|uniref:transient receptor potential cation channel subfamily A member 1-like isoform X2 n=1 Tax=Lytechinus variegatus TaxID=7654 RepID=UPI001BB2569D|nr:transient receptor potential cation channel subfamily A member 1-like isoform X2 [Lytechinus variegatus]
MMSSSADDTHSRNGKKKKKKGKVGKVYPMHPVVNGKGSDREILIDQRSGKDKDLLETTTKRNSAANVISNYQMVKKGVEKFKGLKCGRRSTAGISSTKKFTLVRGIDASISPDPLSANVANAELIGYFGHLATSSDANLMIDLEYLELILNRGADINCTDKYGQTALHEISRTWDPDIAVFMIEKGSNVNQADLYGRTPLHVAAAVDFPEMIKVLLDNGAYLESLTEKEQQTPLHYAARNDACESMRILLKKGADIHVRDYKGRTPLLLAAELDRSETSHLLLEMGARAYDVDRTGHTALQVMVTKMPAVAKEGLNQLYRCDRANRKQYYDLHLLEPLPLDSGIEVPARTVLQSIVLYNQLELIMHPVCRQLIEVKWQKFGRTGAFKQLAFNLLFILMWTVLACSLKNPFEYTFPQDIWRLILEICGGILTIYQIVLELNEYSDSKKKFIAWRNWRITEIEKDFKFCHPQWPQERQYLDQEVSDIKDQAPSYFSDKWNLFDWLIYISLLIVTLLHVVDIFVNASGLSTATQNIFAIVIIFVWLRLMKSVRAFVRFGPFIVMLGLIASDFGTFLYLYGNFYVPYACAFWMTYGGNNGTIPSMMTVDQLMYSLFRITLVDEYDYEGMRQENVWMTYILLVSFLMISAILCINVLIAMLSNTFQRVYDNATAIAIMQQTKIILSIEDGLAKKKKRKYFDYIRAFCSPQSLYYDDDMTSEGGDDLKKMTFQIKDSLQELDEYIREEQHHAHNGNISSLRSEIEEMKQSHEKELKKVNSDLKVVQELLKAVLEQRSDRGGGGEGGDGGIRTLPTLSTQEPPWNDPPGNQTNEPRPTMATGSPRFVGRRDTGTPKPPLLAEDLMDGGPVGAPPKTPDLSVDDIESIRAFKKESKKQRKLRQQREEYLQLQLNSFDQPGGARVPGQGSVKRKGKSGTLPAIRQDGDEGDEEAPPESLVDLVRMQPSVLVRMPSNDYSLTLRHKGIHPNADEVHLSL